MKTLAKIKSLIIKISLWLSMILISLLVVVLYVPIRLVIEIIANILLFILNLVKGLISLFKNKGKLKPLVEFSGFGLSLEKTLRFLISEQYYKGKSIFLRKVDNNVNTLLGKIRPLPRKTVNWIITAIISGLMLFIYNPIRFVLNTIAKLFLLIILLFKSLISLIKNKGKVKPLVKSSGFILKFENFLKSVQIKLRYKGKNKFLKNIDSNVLGNRTAMTYIEIFTFALLLLFFAPFALIILNATKTANEIIANPLAIAGNTETFLKNINNILTSDTVKYWKSFLNSLIITSGSLLTIGIFSAMAAWVLVRTKKAYSRFIFILFLSGMVIPFQVVMLPLVRLLDIFTTNLGIPMKDTYHGIILVYIGFGAPLSVFMFHGFIKSIPMDIEEAATIDGCTRSQMFFRIIIPILKPIFVTLLVLNGLWIWNDYLLPSLVVGINGDVRTLPLAVANLAGAYVRQWDLLLTSVLLAAIPVIILFLFAQKFIIKGMTSGAIK